MPPLYRLITLLGPTAVGKTSLAARLAHSVGGEVISADSRQVFKGMDLGTGKDRKDYLVQGILIPSHLVDIAEAGTEYSLFSFIRDFKDAFNNIHSRGKMPVLCGGTGLYLEAVLQGYDLVEIPANPEFRESLASKSNSELLEMISAKRQLHNTTDSLERGRIIRALEIETFRETVARSAVPEINPYIVFGLRFDRQIITERITQRLKSRLEQGMIEEVESLMKMGVAAKMLKYYGLEYKYVVMFLLGELSYEKMFSLLNTSIHQFAKRQMTWFRRMERNGILIHWLEGEDGQEQNLQTMLDHIKNDQWT
jgi:tRNA dimethylallyltransferase